MKSKNNQLLILTSVLCLLPIIMSCVVYKDLPEQIAVHWDSAGNPNTFFPKAVAAFGLPVLFAAINIFSIIMLFNDPKRANASHTMRMFTIWLIPVLSLILIPVTLFIAMGVSIPIFVITQVLVGIILIVTGNYLPKSRQNYTIGIKLPWTLHNTSNWNKTHRVAGYLYMLGGFALLIYAFVSYDNARWSVIITVILILLFLLPVFYSFLLYRKSGGNGETDKTNEINHK